MKTHGEVNHRPGARLSAGSQTVLPTVRFSPATTVEFTAVVNSAALRAKISGETRLGRQPEYLDAYLFGELPDD